MRVLIVGASDKPERYSNRAMRRLLDAGHEVVLLHPRHKEIEGRAVANSLSGVEGPIDTVTLYVGPDRLRPMVDGIVALRPRRIISNPGTETPEMAARAREAGIEYLEACTLVLLATGAF